MEVAPAFLGLPPLQKWLAVAGWERGRPPMSPREIQVEKQHKGAEGLDSSLSPPGGLHKWGPQGRRPAGAGRLSSQCLNNKTLIKGLWRWPWLLSGLPLPLLAGSYIAACVPFLLCRGESGTLSSVAQRGFAKRDVIELHEQRSIPWDDLSQHSTMKRRKEITPKGQMCAWMCSLMLNLPTPN